MEWANEKVYNAFLKQCGKCKHFDEEQEDAGFFVCAAFPDGIPEDLLLNKKSHSKPYPGDQGIRFEQRS